MLSSPQSPARTQPSLDGTVTLPIDTSTHPMVTRAKQGTFKPEVLTVSSSSSQNTSLIPQTFNQAVIIPEWKHAMMEEFNALL